MDKLTVCLNDRAVARDEAYVDANNAPWAEAALIEAGVAKRVGFGESGYCKYPRLRFDIGLLGLFVPTEWLSSSLRGYTRRLWAPRLQN